MRMKIITDLSAASAGIFVSLKYSIPPLFICIRCSDFLHDGSSSIYITGVPFILESLASAFNTTKWPDATFITNQCSTTNFAGCGYFSFAEKSAFFCKKRALSSWAVCRSCICRLSFFLQVSDSCLLFYELTSISSLDKCSDIYGCKTCWIYQAME